MFIATLFTIAKTCKQPKCSSTEEWIKKMWHIYTMEYYSATKMNEVMMHATTQIKLKNIARNKRTQIQKVIYYIPLLI